MKKKKKREKSFTTTTFPLLLPQPTQKGKGLKPRIRLSFAGIRPPAGPKIAADPMFRTWGRVRQRSVLYSVQYKSVLCISEIPITTVRSTEYSIHRVMDQFMPSPPSAPSSSLSLAFPMYYNKSMTIDYVSEYDINHLVLHQEDYSRGTSSSQPEFNRRG